MYLKTPQLAVLDNIIWAVCSLVLNSSHLASGRTLGFSYSCLLGVPKRAGLRYTLSEFSPCSGGHQLRQLGSWGLCSAFLFCGHLESLSSLSPLYIYSPQSPALLTFWVWWCCLSLFQLWLEFVHQLFILLPPAATHLCISFIYKETLPFVFSSFRREVA